MSRITPLVIASAVVSLSLLVATYTANPWAVLVTSSLFVFVWFPRWRGSCTGQF